MQLIDLSTQNVHSSLKTGPSVVGGLGVFATEALPADEYIEMAKCIVLDETMVHLAFFFAISNGMDRKNLILDQYSIKWDTDRIAIPLGNVSLYNHSDEPNCTYMIRSFEEQLIGVKTLREIQPGEELTVSYGPDWFQQKEYLTQVKI